MYEIYTPFTTHVRCVCACLFVHAGMRLFRCVREFVGVLACTARLLSRLTLQIRSSSYHVSLSRFTCAVWLCPRPSLVALTSSRQMSGHKFMTSDATVYNGCVVFTRTFIQVVATHTLITGTDF